MDDKYAHNKHTTVMLTTVVKSKTPLQAPQKAARNIGPAMIANKINVIGIALGCAALTVQPIHLIPFGTITRGSALQ